MTIPFIIVTALAIYGWIVLDDIEAQEAERAGRERHRPAVHVDVRLPARSKREVERARAAGRPAGPLQDPRDRRAPLVLGARVPHEAGRRAGHRRPTRASRPTGRARTRSSAPSCAASATRRCASRCASSPRPSGRPGSKERREGGAAPEEGESPTAAGREIFTSAGCNACHTLADADATAQVGPNLDELAAVAEDREQGTSAEDYVQRVDRRPAGLRGEGILRGYHARELRGPADA